MKILPGKSDPSGRYGIESFLDATDVFISPDTSCTCPITATPTLHKKQLELIHIYSATYKYRTQHKPESSLNCNDYLGPN